MLTALGIMLRKRYICSAVCNEMTETLKVEAKNKLYYPLAWPERMECARDRIEFCSKKATEMQSWPKLTMYGFLQKLLEKLNTLPWLKDTFGENASSTLVEEIVCRADLMMVSNEVATNLLQVIVQNPKLARTHYPSYADRLKTYKEFCLEQLQQLKEKGEVCEQFQSTEKST